MTVRNYTLRGLCLGFLVLSTLTAIRAEGIKQLVPNDTNIVMLHTNSDDFGNFAEWNSNDTNALFVRLTMNDTLYVGLSPQALPDGGEWAGDGDYAFRILAPDGTVVFGPHQISTDTTNATTWDLANAGPDVLNIAGYSTDLNDYPFARFVPDTVGDFKLEFTDGNGSMAEPGDVVNIKFYDFTVVQGGMELPGRLWSRQWGLRTPPIEVTLPECGFDRQFNGVLYSYTLDGFVSRIDFDSSGFQGLSFTVAFGNSGPGNTGNVILDRMSVNNMNATAGAADHMAFISEPDVVEFPSPQDPCGQADLLSVECFADSFCINVGVTQPGQIELLLDFNDNGVYDPDSTDVILAMIFETTDTTCVPWDGLDGEGMPAEPGAAIPTFLRYSQGVQHYAKYDVELLKYGFCVETVRPICPGLETNILYWDDSNIADNVGTVTIDESESGTGQPQVQLDGCECQVDSCRTWTNFQLGDLMNSCQATPLGYGEENTLNTWWFGRTTMQGPIALPLAQVEIVGDTVICPGDSTELTAVPAPDTVDFSFAWSGPMGFSSDSASTGPISVPGVYSVTITDTLNNCSAVDSVTVIESPAIMLTLSDSCQADNMQESDIDLTVSGGTPPFSYLWSNGAMTEDLVGVLPDTYTVTVTDDAGCEAIDSITVTPCCELMIECPSEDGGLFACATDVPAEDTTLITVTDYCEPLEISSMDIDNGADGCPGDTLIITRIYTITDGAGNSAACIQTFQVVDNIPPMLVECPADTAVDCNSPTDTMTLGAPVFADACDGVTLTYEDDSTGFAGCTNGLIGQIARTFYAADSCGNVDSCVQVISVIDTTAPTITFCPPDITVDCENEPDDTQPTATDNCTSTENLIITFEDDSQGGSCAQDMPITRTWMVEDDCGNVATCQQLITIQDTIPPTLLTCPNDTIFDCGADTDTSLLGTPTYADNCSEVIITFVDDSMGFEPPANLGVITRTFFGTDICGNVDSSCVQIITIQDVDAPTAMCPPDLTISCEMSADTSETGSPIVSDNCVAPEDLIVTFEDDTTGLDGPCFEGTIIRTFTVADLEDNTTTCSHTITIEDNDGPSFSAPADVTIECDQDPDDTGITGTVSDVMDCSEISDTSYTDQADLTGCNGTGEIIRSWVVEDACGNSTTETQTITVVDNTAPTAICQDITIDFSGGDTQMITPEDVDDGSFDNCGDVTLELSEDTFECLTFVNGTQIQLLVTDDCGNQSSCTSTVTGEGGTGLAINCPDDITINLPSGICEQIVNYQVTVESLCGDAATNAVIEQVDDSGLTSGDFFPTGTTVQCYIAYVPGSDDTVMCCFDITIIPFPEEEFLACNDTVNISVDQNCEVLLNPDMILEGDVYGCFDNFIIEVEGYESGQGELLITNPVLNQYLTVTITNMAGNSCWGHLIMEDKIPPTIECEGFIVPCTQSIDPADLPPVVEVTVEESVEPGSAIGPDGGAVTEASIILDVPAGATVGDVNVTVDLNHSWSSDLDVFLVAPNGTSIELATDVCGSSDDWENVIFDDEAGIAVGSACGTPALSGPVQPEGSLSDLDGSEISGTWTLMITDDTGGDGGTLNLFGLTVYFEAQSVPEADDNCGPVSLTYTDAEATGDDCQALTVIRTWTVTDPSGNSASCDQEIQIIPLDLDDLEFPETHLGLCGDSDHPNDTGWPSVDGMPLTDGNICNIFTTWWDHIIPGCGGGTKIQREWTVLDWCTQELVTGIQLLKFTDEEGPEFTFCPPDITVSTDPWFCMTDVNLQIPHAEDACLTPFTLTPGASSGILIPFGGAWRLDSLGIGDHVVTWTAEDECGNTSTCTYTITVEDRIPPVPLCDEHTVVSLTEDLYVENGLTKIPAEVFDDGSYDNCTPVTFEARRIQSCIDFDWTTNGAGIDETPNNSVDVRDRGQVFRTKVPFACCDVGQGRVMVELRVTDEHGNANTCMVEVDVQDKLPPLVECPPDVIVSCDFWFEAHETAGFIDQDEDPLSHVFGRVLDAAQYEPNDRQEIVINDPGRPTNPSHPDYLPQPYTWGIDGWADDNCEVEISVRVRIFDDCSGDDFSGPSPYTTRLVERSFRARDAQGNIGTCVQHIWVVDFDPFKITDEVCGRPFNPNAFPEPGGDDVRWPCDLILTDCPQGELTPENLSEFYPDNAPLVNDDNCSLIGVTYEDEIFEFVDGACRKILREWIVIDWCQYDAETGYGYWTYTQIIKVHDETGPVFLDCPAGPVTLCVADPNVELPANNQVFLSEDNPNATSCSVHVRMERLIRETCSDYVTYDVKVYPNNGSQYLQVVAKTDVDVDSNSQAVLVMDTKTSSILAVRQSGLPYNDKYCLGLGGPKDYHRILWSVEDGCGNLTTCEYLFRLEDCKQPSPVCVGLSSVVMPTSGEVTIWAIDFDASSFDDCTAHDDLLYSFSGETYQPSRSFTCQDIDDNGSPSFVIEIWVADEGNDQDCNGIITWAERNKDYCTTFIVVDDNEGVCPQIGSVGGEIRTEDIQYVENVNVILTDGSGQMMEQYTTDDNGFYHFANPLLDYDIRPERNDDHRNGVSTLDLVRIQQHLLGLDRFNSPYKYIAADANNSQSVSAIDLVEIRKLILGVNLQYPNNQSWRFVPQEFAFIDPHSPWPFDEYIDLQHGFTLNEDFIAIKIGDINGTVIANATQVATRNARRVLQLQTVDRVVQAGEMINIPVSAENFTQMMGYQFTLRTSGLELQQVKGDALNVSLDNIGMHKGALTMSWHQAQPATVTAGETLFTLQFAVTESGKLSDMLEIGSGITEAEAYAAVEQDAAEELFDISLVMLSDPTVIASEAGQYALFQNEPNPFTDETVISFTLPETMEAALTVFDVTGKVVHAVNGEFTTGYNEVSIGQKELSATGVLYYRLDAGDFSATKKMIVIE